MPGRSFSTPSYRYGFNGKEKDDEAQGSGNQYDYGFRIYNPRLARFLSVDPLTKSYPMLTPYQFASNSPILNLDLDGLEAWNVMKNRWSVSDIEGYRKFVSTEIRKINAQANAEGKNSNTCFDCVDLTTTLVIRYAAVHGLPVTFTDVNGRKISAADENLSFKGNKIDYKTNTKENGDESVQQFIGLVRSSVTSESVQADITSLPLGQEPRSGDIYNQGYHQGLVLNPADFPEYPIESWQVLTSSATQDDRNYPVAEFGGELFSNPRFATFTKSKEYQQFSSWSFMDSPTQDLNWSSQNSSYKAAQPQYNVTVTDENNVGPTIH